MVSPAVGSAATFGLTVGGGYLFGPIGAAAGALLGSFLFGSGGGPNVEGPRLGDTTIGASTYGNVIPIAFATQKLAGMIIWAPEIDEVKSSEKVGGGLLGGIFGGGQKITEYRYYASFAVAFAEGPAAGLVRLWAGDKLIADFHPPDFSADLTDGSQAMRRYGSNGRYKFRFYRGTSTQQPDPLIRNQVEDELDESHITPGFRDIVYIVFERMALDEFGNRVPPITAEIAWDNDIALPNQAFASIGSGDGGIFPNGLHNVGFGAVVDWQQGYFYVYRNGNTLMGGSPGFAAIACSTARRTCRRIPTTSPSMATRSTRRRSTSTVSCTAPTTTPISPRSSRSTATPCARWHAMKMSWPRIRCLRWCPLTRSRGAPGSCSRAATSSTPM